MTELPLEAELLPDETLLWSGQSDPSRILTRWYWYLIPFSLFWCGFSIFWEYSVIRTMLRIPGALGTSAVFVLAGALFVLVGLYLVAGRFWLKTLRKRRTYYGVTSRRVLELTELAGKHLKSAYIAGLPSINTSLRTDGSGSISFGWKNLVAGAYANTGLDAFTIAQDGGSLAFYDIRDAKAVYDLVTDLRNRAPAA